MVDDFLGTSNAQIFSDALADCMTDVSNVTIGLASLVPTLSSVKSNTDIQAVLAANAASEKGQIQLTARLSMIFNLENLEHEIEALDQSTTLLEKFTRNIITHHQPGQHAPSRKAAKLAKALQIVRQHAVNLHSALIRQWTTPCHQRHELQIFLEERLTEPKPKQAANESGVSCFKVIFVTGMTQSTDFSHETLFYIEAEEPQINTTTLPSQGPRIRFSAPQRQPADPKLDVSDICAAISGAASKTKSPIFHLAGAKNVAMTLHTQVSATTQSSLSPSATLQKIFQDRNNQSSPSSPLPWKWRMVLALKIASSFLQFIRTPWAQPSWSASHIYIPYTASNSELDLKRPFVSADFSKNCSLPVKRQAQVKEDLLELGILLLEIWHEKTLETQFVQQLSTDKTPLMRRACALQWLEDLQNPLPDLYYSAASHCISGFVIPDLRASEWDHPDLWKCICENVIHPLSKVAQI